MGAPTLKPGGFVPGHPLSRLPIVCRVTRTGSCVVYWPLDSRESAPAHQLMQRFESPAGVIMGLKQGNIQRKAALEAMKMWHQGQLEVAEVQIAQAVRVHTTKARVEAEPFLARIDTEYLDYLAELGLRNVGKRQEMLVRLANQTTLR